MAFRKLALFNAALQGCVTALTYHHSISRPLEILAVLSGFSV
jgi:hypothetical protein